MEILGIITYLILCLCAWVIASRKGRFGFGYFLLSIIFTPLLGLIIAFVVSDKSKQIVIINNINNSGG